MTTASNLSEAVKSNFLDLDGGVMNGTISMDEIVSMKRSSNESYMQINGGSSWGNGASLELFGKDHTSKGKFLLWAHNGTDCSTMEGFPDGYLTWNNKQVVCVESWNDGTSWYRKYSDGFMEQGGNFSIANDSYTTSVTFPKAFSNTNYVLTFGINSSSSSGTQFRHHGSISRTQTSFVTWANSSFITKSWHACGF